MDPKSELRKLPPLSEMLVVPDDPTVAAAIGKDLWKASVQRFTETLAVRELNLWGNPPDNWREHPAQRQLLNRFHVFLLNVMWREQGSKLLLSRDFQNVIGHIERNSPELCKRLGEVLARKSKEFLGLACSELPVDIVKFHDEAIPELKIVLRRLKEKYRRSIPTCRDVADTIERDVTERPGEFQCLPRELPTLLGFIAVLPTWDKEFASKLVRGKIRAETLWLEWVSVGYHRSKKDIQNKVAKLRA